MIRGGIHCADICCGSSHAARSWSSTRHCTASVAAPAGCVGPVHLTVSAGAPALMAAVMGRQSLSRTRRGSRLHAVTGGIGTLRRRQARRRLQGAAAADEAAATVAPMRGHLAALPGLPCDGGGRPSPQRPTRPKPTFLASRQQTNLGQIRTRSKTHCTSRAVPDCNTECQQHHTDCCQPAALHAPFPCLQQMSRSPSAVSMTTSLACPTEHECE